MTKKSNWQRKFISGKRQQLEWENSTNREPSTGIVQPLIFQTATA